MSDSSSVIFVNETITGMKETMKTRTRKKL